MPPPASTSTSSLRVRAEAAAALWFLAVGALLALALAMPSSSWFGPLEAQRAGQMPLVLLRLIALCAALVVLPAAGRRARWALGAGLAALVLLSCVVNAATLGVVLLAAVLVWRTGLALRPRAVPLHAALLLFALGSVWSLGPPLPALGPAATPRDQALYWLERDNPHRALPHANAWARAEARPGDGALALARLARRFGEETEAKRIAEQVLARGAAESQARARSFLGGAP